MSLKKNGIWTEKNFSSSIINQFDTKTYVEPDGSSWIRIFHHNAPKDNGLFEATDTFTKGVYKDENRWFNVSLCNYLSENWELMVKQKMTSADNEEKFRWVQTANPMTATYDDVYGEGKIDINKSSEYVDFTYTYGTTNILFGGIFQKSGSTYLRSASVKEGNWFGAIGCYTVYQEGIPTFWRTSPIGAGLNSVTTGYMDLYLRVDNITTPNFRINKGGVMATDFIEY